MTWIKTVPYSEADGRLKRLYDRVKGPADNVDNIMMAHSLRPHSMEGHMALYKNVLHHAGNTLPKWFLEALGVFVSQLNRCPYCVEHHAKGMARLLGDATRTTTIRKALESEKFETAFTPSEALALDYARMVTLSPFTAHKSLIDGLLQAGFTDGEVLEINQVVAYFNYANRTVLGLGVTTEGDVLGLSPGDNSDPDNWQHA